MSSNLTTREFIRRLALGTAGIHPHNADRVAEADFAAIRALAAGMPKIVAVPMPTSANQSRSRTIPSRDAFDPIQCHHTPVLALRGGFSNTVCGSGAANACGGVASARKSTACIAASAQKAAKNNIKIANAIGLISTSADILPKWCRFVNHVANNPAKEFPG